MTLYITHCERKIGLGGEDIAIYRLKEKIQSVELNIFSPSHHSALSMLSFFFSISFFIYVFRLRRDTHIIVNPFPHVSIFSLLLLGVIGKRLRLYIHDFGLSCPASTHFKEGAECFSCTKKKYSFQKKCFKNRKLLVLGIIRNIIFYWIFMKFKKNKVLFVGEFQRELAVEAGIPRRRTAIAGNIL